MNLVRVHFWMRSTSPRRTSPYAFPTRWGRAARGGRWLVVHAFTKGSNGLHNGVSPLGWIPKTDRLKQPLRLEHSQVFDYVHRYYSSQHVGAFARWMLVRITTQLLTVRPQKITRKNLTIDATFTEVQFEHNIRSMGLKQLEKVALQGNECVDRARFSSTTTLDSSNRVHF